MTQEEKQLLLKELCARLPYGVKIELTWWVMGEGTCINTTLESDQIEQLLNDEDGDTDIKPYLRPLSSMTEEEDKEWQYYKNAIAESCDERLEERISELYDWFNANHFDYRGLIPKGLAIEVTKENNPYEEINM